MKKLFKYPLTLLVVLLCSAIGSNYRLVARNSISNLEFQVTQQQDTITHARDTISEASGVSDRVTNKKSPFYIDNPDAKDNSLPYSFDDVSDNQELGSQNESPLYLKNPKNIVTTIQYDPLTGNYILVTRIGDLEYRRPTSMTAEEYEQYEAEKSLRDYWMERSRNDGVGSDELVPDLELGGQFVDKIFGSNTISIKPQGSAELTFGISTTTIDNPTISENLRKTTSFDFDEKIQMNVSGTVGEKLQMDVNYDTEATFDFENEIKLEYTGDEDEIIDKIEAGNVSMPISNSLITGGQDLFGVKAQMQFGKLSLTTVLSQQEGETSVIELENGAESNEFDISADEYEANRNFFLSKYFYDNYDEALENLPTINSSIAINKVEVWVTNKTSDYDDARNIVGFVDLGENEDNIYNSTLFSQTGTGDYPDNDLNNLYDQMTTTYSGIRTISSVTTTLAGVGSGFASGYDYEKVENARKLSSSEYTLNEELGYITLTSALNSDEVLSVAYQYTTKGKVYQVGEFTSDGVSSPNVLITKLLKGTTLSPKMPTWTLMMKNIYNIGAYQVEEDDFVLNVLYDNDEAGTSVNYISEGDIKGEILLKVFNLDNVDSNLDEGSDGVFDFIEGTTILSTTGRIIFPVVEPFGSYLREKIGSNTIADDYVFEELYELSQSDAQEVAEQNKFSLSGSYSSSTTSSISLDGTNIEQGSVTVKAGGVELEENVDYTVDYTLGRVTIINQSLLESNTSITIESSSSSSFETETTTLLGMQMDYAVNDNFNLGATLMYLSEQSQTDKVNVGDEAMANTMWGLNGSYTTESMFITRMLDKLPFYETKEASSISIEGEFANLIPGSNTGTSYIDDFEGSETSIDLKSVTSWSLASTPQSNETLFPEGDLTGDLAYGYNRAKLAWYYIDPLFLRDYSTTPSHIKSDDDQQSNYFVREVYEEEIWPNMDSYTGESTTVSVFNLAFYPDEKGPYNYDVDGEAGVSQGMNEDGTLKDPESRWGGIMRKMETTNFESSNISYIEFWVMDPFVYETDHTGGDLYFNLGNISEDVLKDGRKSFENGLPTSEEVTLVDTTVWGRVPNVQSVVYAFDNSSSSREYQDVGLDGLSDSDELTFFDDYVNEIASSINLGPNSEAYSNAEDDPSSDDYHYFRGSDYDADEVSILERYKKYNGPDGNSPTSDLSSESYTTSATTVPNSEDINKDNTLSESESYYQYKVHLEPDGMVIGQNFIVDKITSTVDLENGSEGSVDWYQFKIPIDEYDDSYGTISDFTSIRFMRMFMKGFDEDIILRFATLDLVRDEWKSYEGAVNEDDDDEVVSEGSFEISSVNIEENSEKDPVNYVLPPDIDRTVDASNSSLVEENEQSMILKVTNLEDGKGQAAYKSLGLDVRKYGSLIMDVHAEEIDGYDLDDEDLRIFIRFGSDYQDNYYEYEIPLILTPAGDYDDDSDDDRLIVWPEENQFNFELSLFTELKTERNTELNSAGSNVDYTTPYEMYAGDISDDVETIHLYDIVRIKGNPSLGDLDVAMIGIKNPSQDNDDSDDGLDKSVEVWVNELRLTDFDEDGGWAANLTTTVKLADLGTVNYSTSMITAGFGSIDDGVSDRYTDDIYSYDFSTSLELGKLFGNNSGISIPMYYAISEETVTPEYYPLDDDLLLDDVLDSYDTTEERDSILNLSQEYTKKKSFNLTNVGIQKKDGESKILDASNLSLTYSFNETYSRDEDTEYEIEQDYRYLVSYNYSGQPKSVQPFKKVKLFQKPAFRLLKDFNFYYMPSQISVRSDVQRYYNETLTRDVDEDTDVLIEATYDKDFIWYRYYDLTYNLTKGLKFDFSATNTSSIDEPDGIVDKDRDTDAYEIWKDSIWNNLMDGGRNIQYHHDFTVNYTLPISKIPLLNWTSLTSSYSGSYDWDAGSVTSDSIELGNTIQNSNTIQMNGQFNFVNLYNKVGILKKINRKYSSNRKYKQKKENYKKVKYEGTVDELKAGIPTSIYHKLGTQNISVKAYDTQGKEVKVQVKSVTANRAKITANKNVKNVRVRVNGNVSESESVFTVIGENFLRTLMSVRSVSISYSEINSSSMPGYLPETNYFGGETYNGTKAPGFSFLIGNQDKDYGQKSADKGWITTDDSFYDPYEMSSTENFTFRSTLEPIDGLQITISANRSFSQNRSEYYVYDQSTDSFSGESLSKSGSFSMSFLSLKSAFFTIGNTDDYSSVYFDDFLSRRKTESLRLAQIRYGEDYSSYALTDDDGKLTGYYEGYGSTSQEVLIPAFLKAYGNSGKSHSTLFPSISQIQPNWKVTYDGLTNLSLVKRYFKSINITHSYSSTYNVGSYSTNLSYEEDENGLSTVVDLSDNYLPLYEANSVSISEQLNPLISVDMVMNNSFTSSFEINRTRSMILSLSSTQLTEVASNEIVFGLGYKFDDFGMIIGSGSKQKKFTNSLNLSGDLSIRKNTTIIRDIVDEVDELTSGQKVVTLEVSADYVLNDRFNLRLYYDRTVNTPYVSLSYPTITAEFGASIQFSLSN
ncbi:cell surface protein SprA [Labilibaculum sp.]|uniref:T9SS outer membrane translocon Sov/SprA n=1 Tax=Labilibaculum sp. TaxID=2060723 RepID=UPI003567B134